MPRYLLTRRFRFSAAHRLHNPALQAAENTDLFGPCAGLHGHNYRLEVTLAGRPDPVAGFFCDVQELDAVVREQVIARCDHRNLEEADLFAQTYPLTMENLAARVWELIEPACAERGWRLYEVAVGEDTDCEVRLRDAGHTGSDGSDGDAT